MVSGELAGSWQNSGPRELFRRPLSGGHSTIVAAEGRIFVLHGAKKTEKLTALRDDGKLIWEREFAVGYGASVKDHDGPHATPLLWQDFVITVSIDATIRAWKAADGELVWQRDLRKDHGVVLPQAGYAASPLLVGETLLLPGLGAAGSNYKPFEKEGFGVFAFNARNGQTKWTRCAFASSHASPILVQLGNKSIAVFHGMEKLVGIAPDTGKQLWRFNLRTDAADNVSFLPLWDPLSRTLFVSHAYDRDGMQAIQLDKQGGKPTKRWSNRKLKVEHGNAVLLDGVLIAAHGSTPGLLVALDAKSGDLLWRERLPKATLLRVGQRVLILDEEGTLHLAQPNRKGARVISSKKVFSETTWTAPTLVGNRLYLRSPSHLVALQLP